MADSRTRLTRCQSRVDTSGAPGQFTKKPGTGHGPFAFDGGGRDAQHLGGLRDREPNEVAEFDDIALLLVLALETGQSVVEAHQVDVLLAGYAQSFVEREHAAARIAL